MSNFKTEFYNYTGAPIRANLELNGIERIVIPATKQGVLSGTIEQPRKCLFAGYTKIIYNQDGSVTAKKRPGFKVTKGPWVVELKNDSTQIDIQILTAGLKSLFIPKGISVWYNAQATEQLAEYKLIRWTNPEPDGGSRIVNSGGEIYAAPTTTDTWRVRREPKDLERLFKERSARIAEEKEKDVEYSKAHEARRLRLQGTAQ